MKKYKRSLSYILIIICILLVFPMVSFAHSGRTDSSGGHHDYNNKSGLGYYHYHCGGHPAHLHPNGVCPYSGNNNNYNRNSYKDYITMKEYPKTVTVGDDIILDFTMYSYYNDFSYTITSNDPSIIQVNDDYSLTALDAGSAEITIKTSHTSKTITIQAKEIFAESFRIENKLLNIKLDEEHPLIYTILPQDTTNKDVKFYSSDPNVIFVIGNEFKAVGIGDAIVTGETTNGLKDSIKFHVYEVFPEEIVPNVEDLKIESNKIYKITYEIIPSDANNKKCELICENEDIAVIDNKGTITPVCDGTTNIIIRSKANGISKTIPLEVFHIPCESIDIIDSTEYIFSNVVDISDEILLETKIIPDNATYQDVTWESSNPEIVSINNGFKVNSTGDVILTCIGNDGIVSSVEITIINKNDIIGIVIFLAASLSIVLICVLLSKKKKNSIVENN